jgi:hypothetical protein
MQASTKLPACIRDLSGLPPQLYSVIPQHHASLWVQLTAQLRQSAPQITIDRRPTAFQPQDRPFRSC